MLEVETSSVFIPTASIVQALSRLLKEKNIILKAPQITFRVTPEGVLEGADCISKKETMPAPIPAPQQPATPPVETVQDLEQKLLIDALTQSQGNRVETARRLGISTRTLYRKLKRVACKVSGCSQFQIPRTGGLCAKHYKRKLCVIPQCDRPSQAKGRCEKHYQQLRYLQSVVEEIRSGKK